MLTLYVENIPEELYEALRKRARQRRRSIAAEVLTMIEENIPTVAEIERRKELLRRVRRIHARGSPLTRLDSTLAWRRIVRDGIVCAAGTGNCSRWNRGRGESLVRRVRGEF